MVCRRAKLLYGECCSLYLEKNQKLEQEEEKEKDKVHERETAGENGAHLRRKFARPGWKLCGFGGHSAEPRVSSIAALQLSSGKLCANDAGVSF